MKKILCIILMFLIVFTACSSVEETNVSFSEEKKAIRMIKVDGKLYYDSGLTDTNPRCGTLDGNLKKTVAEHEIPKKDGECNFDGAEGYQNYSSIAKVVPVKGKWLIFKLFDDPELDMSIFKYCFYIKGKHPNAKSESEIVVLTEDADYNFEKYSKMLSSSRFEPDEKHYRTTFRVYGTSDKWGILLSAKDITNKGLTLLIEQFGGEVSGELQTGDWFSLEVLKEDAWKPCETNPLIYYVWRSIAYIINKNDVTELPVEWKWLYGELSPGQYRLGKRIADLRKPGDYDEEIYYFYFNIE